MIKIARLSEIPEGGMIARQHDGREVLLARIEGEVYAMDNICSHAGAELHEGVLGEDAPHNVTCPWHDAHFDVRTGKVHQETPWATDLAVYRVHLEGEDVLLEL